MNENQKAEIAWACMLIDPENPYRKDQSLESRCEEAIKLLHKLIS